MPDALTFGYIAFAIMWLMAFGILFAYLYEIIKQIKHIIDKQNETPTD